MIRRRAWVGRVVAEPATGTVVGLIGLAVPAAGLIATSAALKTTLLALSLLVVACLVLRDFLSRRSRLSVKKGDAAAMANPELYETINREVVGERLSDIEDMAEGVLRVYGPEVRRVSILLFRGLARSDAHHRHVCATDLTVDPDVLQSRVDYLISNRELIRAGGSVRRIFICHEADLEKQDFASKFLQLVDLHRTSGVVCGLAIRERISPVNAIDFVVFQDSAVLIEDQQATADYRSGRSTVHFRRVYSWAKRFDELWDDNRTPSAVAQLTGLEAVARPMVSLAAWDSISVRSFIETIEAD